MTDPAVSRIRSHIERLSARRPDYRPLLELYAFLYQELDRLQDEVSLPPYELESPGIRFREGFPLFTARKLPVDLASARRLLEAFLEAEVPKKGELSRVASLLGPDRTRLEKVYRLFLSGDRQGLSEMARQANADPDLLIFLIHLALKPSFLALRRAESETLKEGGWREGYCPLCGSLPGMGRLEEEGRRVLWCSLCGHEWPFPRIECPYCRTEDQKSLFYLFSDEEEGYRISACRRCRGYLKTVDARVLEDPAPLELEDVITLHLDILAQEKNLTAEPKARPVRPKEDADLAEEDSLPDWSDV